MKAGTAVLFIPHWSLSRAGRCATVRKSSAVVRTPVGDLIGISDYCSPRSEGICTVYAKSLATIVACTKSRFYIYYAHAYPIHQSIRRIYISSNKYYIERERF